MKCHSELVEALGNNALSYRTVARQKPEGLQEQDPCLTVNQLSFQARTSTMMSDLSERPNFETSKTDLLPLTEQIESLLTQIDYFDPKIPRS
ncbi:hypothetical protein TNCV_2433151 [Trichonephila clavipes]|nr:hypothetical protein TNCV_2433151 [Trichonephila clavipes]